MKQIKKDINKAEEDINTILARLTDGYEDVNFELDCQSISESKVGFAAGVPCDLNFYHRIKVSERER